MAGSWYEFAADKDPDEVEILTPWPGRQPTPDEAEGARIAFRMGFEELKLTYRLKGVPWPACEDRAYREQTEYSDRAWREKMQSEGLIGR